MSYRTSGWVNEFEVEVDDNAEVAFERGADKMFEELSKLPLEELMEIFAEHTDRYEELK